MNKYEILLLTSSDETRYKEIISNFKKIFKNIIKDKPIGLKDLSYEINKEKKGNYHLFIVEANNSMLDKLKYELKINKHLYRYLLISLNKEFKNPDKYINEKLKTDLTKEEKEKFAQSLAKSRDFSRNKKREYKQNNFAKNTLDNTDESTKKENLKTNNNESKNNSDSIKPEKPIKKTNIVNKEKVNNGK